MRKKKVIHLLSSNIFSGAENVVCQIIDIFKNEEDMYYCSPIGVIDELLEKKDINYIPIKSLSLSEVKKVLLDYKPDIIHAHDVRASIIAAICTNRIPIISHLHGNFGNTNRNISKSILYRLFIDRFSSIICVSDSVINEYLFSRYLRKKSIVLYNIINIEDVVEKSKLNKPKEIYDCVFIGRLSYPKDPLRLINIIKNIVLKNPDIKLGVIGDGELKDDLIAAVTEESLQNNIKVLGYLENPYCVLANSKVMIMCSKYEGTPMAALEAMALGIPIVSTPVDGLNKLIESGIEGYLEYDDINLSSRIFNIVNNECLQKKLSRGAIKKSFLVCNINNYKKSLSSIYESVL